ncbi:MAG: transcription antitermination factor NusB [Ruminococcaceae bacterium]|nr:transcription antitermination factor NusB [Oscillospiraceae bacterium]
MTRREARELAFVLLFERSFGDLSVKEILEASAEARDVEADDFALRLAEGAEVRFEESDDLIAQNARNWSTERISRVALAIMRLAIYEMQYEESIPVSVSINEAVELAKKYGGDEDASFINGVLGGIARSVEAGDAQ